VLVEGYVGVPDASLEVDFWGLERVLGGEDKQELEFTALRRGQL